MMGIAVWHFAVFVPDRFCGGIVGAFRAAALGSVAIGVLLAGGQIDDPSLLTALEAIPGRCSASPPAGSTAHAASSSRLTSRRA